MLCTFELCAILSHLHFCYCSILSFVHHRKLVVVQLVVTFLFQGAKDSVGVAQSSQTQQLPPTYSAAIDQHKPPSYTPSKAAAAADAEQAATTSSQK